MFWTPDLIFIHVPRTGGTALTDKYRHLPWLSVDVHEHKHSPASVVRHTLLPDYWTTARRFTIYRSDEEIAKSWWDHIHHSEIGPHTTRQWRETMDKVKNMTWDEYLDSYEPPRFEVYCDRDDVEVLSWDDADALCREILGEPCSANVATGQPPSKLST